MGQQTGIEWCDHTFNGWIGCTKVSPACDHCYAERYGQRFGVGWGHGETRRLTSDANWRKPLAWDRAAERDGVRRRVFANSLSDVFDAEVSDDWRDRLFRTINYTRNLDWLLLTKRPQVARKYLTGKSYGATLMDLENPLPNVWLGTTVENQATADARIPILLSTPAAKRFLSMEPLLEAVSFDAAVAYDGAGAFDYTKPRVDWVIVGGESGPESRPMRPDWVRSLRDQCKAAGVAFFFKQWGDWGPVPAGEPIAENDHLLHDGSIGYLMRRYGKTLAGRALDGATHDMYPA